MILRGRLIPDSETPIDDGRSIPPPVRAKIRLNDGRSVQAIIKRLSPRETAVECFCAELLALWGLPTAPSALVDDGDELVFASLDTGYPSLKRHFGISIDLTKQEQARRARAAGELIKNWDEIPVVIAADEAIRNRDRNLGNILWDGATRTYIDHANALDKTTVGVNKIAFLMVTVCASEKIERAAVSACFTLADDAIKKVTDGMPDTWLEFKNEFADFVSERLPQLANKVIACFPKPQRDLLST